MIKRFVILAVGIVLSATIAAQAATLKLKNGQVYSGTYLGGTRDEVQFQVNGQVQMFKTADLASIRFDTGTEAAAAPAAASFAPASTRDAAYQANSVTVPQGTTVMIRMIDTVDSSVNKLGDIFHASLEDDLRVGDSVVARKGADVYGKLTEAKAAGRVTGKSELALELTGIRTVNGTIQPIVSGEYQQAGKSRTGQTIKHGLGGALAGAAIGAIAGGGSGAAKGAAIGGAAGTAVTAITHGQKVKVPSETLLQFQIAQPFTITLQPSSQ